MKIAIAQVEPVFNNLQESLKLAIGLLEEASSQGAELIVFGETWLCGYPAWIDHSNDTARWNYDPVKAVWAEMYHNSMVVGDSSCKSLQEAAARNDIAVVLGFNEKVLRGSGNSTLYNSFLIIDNSGNLKNHHRKLMPTYTEKLVHGLGDGAGLRSVQLNQYMVGGLICWEHWMPLARQAMHNSNEDIHFALWPMVSEEHQLASRHYAFEGRCYVIAVGQILRRNSMPENLQIRDTADASDLLLKGGSCVIGPDAKFILDPIYNTESIIYSDLPPATDLYKERMNLAVSGHYQRPDVLKLKVKRKVR